MRKRIKLVTYVLFIIFISVALFVCMMCGKGTEVGNGYIVAAAGISLLLPLSISVLIWWELQLKKRLEKLKRK